MFVADLDICFENSAIPFGSIQSIHPSDSAQGEEHCGPLRSTAMQAPRFLTLTAVVSAGASWLPVYDNNGSPVCTVGGTLQCTGGTGQCECVGTAPTVVPPPCDTTLESYVPDCYSRCRDVDGACITYFSCPEGFSKSDMIWTCESGHLANLLGYDYQENIKLLADKSYSRVITSSTYDDGETWTPSCHSPGPQNYAVGYQTCYTLDPNVGVPTTTTTTTTWGIPIVWENVGEPGKSACRGQNASWQCLAGDCLGSRSFYIILRSFYLKNIVKHIEKPSTIPF